MLTNIADAIIIPTYEKLVTQTELLASSEGDLSDYCSAIGTSEESSKEALAKDSWKASMAVVQGSEMLAIGPATDNGSSFRKKILSLNVLEKTNLKDKSTSRKGAFLFGFKENLLDDNQKNRDRYNTKDVF